MYMEPSPWLRGASKKEYEINSQIAWSGFAFVKIISGGVINETSLCTRLRAYDI